MHGTINGFGERCGNANLSSIIPNLKLKMGCQLSAGENLHQLTQLSNYFYEIANLIPNDYQPFVGKLHLPTKGACTSRP